MARKKTEITEEIITTETIDTPIVEAVEEKPKRSRKKKVEEPVAEEPAVAEPIAEAPAVVPNIVEEVKVEESPVVEEVKPAPVKIKKEKQVVAPAKESSFTPYMVQTTRVVSVLRYPGHIAHKLGSYGAGIKFEILEESMGWGKVADGKWVNLNYVEKI